MLVDFSLEIPKLYQSSLELKEDGIVSENFNLSLENLNYNNFFSDILNTYNSRFNL